MNVVIATTRTGFERIFRCPTETQLRELKRRRQDEAPANSRGVMKKRKAMEGEG